MQNKAFWDLVGKEFTEPVKIKEAPVAEEPQKSEEVIEGRWSVINGKIYFPSTPVAQTLATGTYRAKLSMSYGIYWEKQKVLGDNLLELPDDDSTEVLHHITEFWAMKDAFKKYGFLHKRGVMLYGPQGSGKTSTVIQTIKKIEAMKGVVLLGNYPGYDLAAIKDMRELEPDRPIVVVYEDLDDVIMNYGDRIITEMLDGEANVDNVLYLATTNHPQRLPARLINRPSRFDVVKFIGLPSKEARTMYLKAKTDMMLSEISIWADKTDGLSIPHLKELIILVKVLKKDLDESITILKNMKKIPNSRDFGQEVV